MANTISSATPEEIPNEETLEAFKEVEQFEKDPSGMKTYQSFGDFMEEENE